MHFVTNKDWRVIFRLLGEILIVTGPALLIPGIIAVFYDINYAIMFTAPGLLCSLFGYGLINKFKSASQVRMKHAAIVSALVWLVIPLFSVIPFLASDFSFLDAYFECMSGFTTTGLTIMQHIESYPHPLLLFRTFTHFIGGVGIIVLFLMILTRPEGGHLYQSETRSDRIKPSLKGTAIETWKIYSFFVIICAILLYTAGMPFFDAVNHSISALSTGGFSTKDASIGAYNDLVFVKLILILFMIIGATSFLLHFKILDGDFKAFLKNEEFKFMIAIMIAATLLITVRIMLAENLSLLNGVGEIEDVLFQVVSLMTSTGFTTVDILAWDPFAKIVLLVVMIVGGCVGSTAGGLKVIRVLILWKITWRTIKKSFTPQAAIIPLKVMGRQLKEEEILFTTGLTLAYLMLVLAGVLIFLALNYNPLDSILQVASAISDIGATFFPGDVWSGMGVIEKVTLIILMYAGRLEIFPVLVLITALIKRGKI